MDLGIQGRKALVCASSKGMGRAIAKALSLEGVELFLCSREPDSLEITAGEIERSSGQAVHRRTCDLSSIDSRNQLIKEVLRTMGSVDILIHNTGGPPPSTVLDSTLEMWEKAFQQLFQSVAHLNQAFLADMMGRRWGRIIAVTSLSVMEPIPGLALSNGMRSAVTTMMKTLADEVASYNICVNCVSPGIIQTDRTTERIRAKMKSAGGTEDVYLREYLKLIPAGRIGTPEEFADVVCFLSSQRASYLTGSTICVDGGKRKSSY